MHRHFPSIDAVSRDWKHLIVGETLSERAALDLMNESIASDEVLVHVHRHLGASCTKAEAVKLIAQYWGHSDIKVADRNFLGFVVIAQNGVGTGWKSVA
jgi:hypothetical protein